MNIISAKALKRLEVLNRLLRDQNIDLYPREVKESVIDQLGGTERLATLNGPTCLSTFDALSELHG